jgi:fibronectin-binding autotransporter adhesin
MSASLAHRRSALAVAHVLFSVVVLATVSNASAGDITYNIVNYPVNEVDNTGGTDTVSGTIITDGTIGPLTASNMVGGSLTVSGLAGTFSSEPTNNVVFAINQGDPNNRVIATSTQLLVPSNGFLDINTSPSSSSFDIEIGYFNNAEGVDFYDGTVNVSDSFDPVVFGTEFNGSLHAPGSIAQNPTWVIARIPPSVWTLAVSGNWSDSTKWTNGVPDADGAVAVIAASTSTALTISLDAPQTVGTLVLGSGTPGVGYTLNGTASNTLTFSNLNNNAPAQISVNDGTHFIDAPVVLASDLVVTSTSSTPWTLTFGTASSITDEGAGYSLTMSGTGGTLVLSGTDSYSGGTIVTAGTLIVTSPNAIADGSSLTVGDASQFSPVIPDMAASGITPSPVPEPSTLALLTAAVCSAAVYHRLRSRRKKR